MPTRSNRSCAPRSPSTTRPAPAADRRRPRARPRRRPASGRRRRRLSDSPSYGPTGAAGKPGPSLVGRAVGAVETAAGACLAFVMALTFVSVIMRYVFSVQVPDNYDFARLITGVFIFWGIAVAGYRGEHIQMDAVWYVTGRRGRRAIDVFATTAALAFFGLLSERLVERVGADIANQTTTFNLSVVIWPFHLTASLGMFAAAVLVALRLWRLVVGAGPEDGPPPEARGG